MVAPASTFSTSTLKLPRSALILGPLALLLPPLSPQPVPLGASLPPLLTRMVNLLLQDLVPVGPPSSRTSLARRSVATLATTRWVFAPVSCAINRSYCCSSSISSELARWGLTTTT